jgi:hypothetical protein
MKPEPGADEPKLNCLKPELEEILQKKSWQKIL